MITDDLNIFLTEWNNPSPTLEVQTSGSTGAPKRLTVRKEQMWQSARLTCEHLGLRRGDTALLCMPLQYIAGKMMVVRSLYAGLDLVVREPSGHPLADVETPLRFAAMIPLQVYNTLQVTEERERLRQTDILLIGGGAIDASLEAEIRQLPGQVYATYGMTETLSHIALRRLNGDEASLYYTPFPGVRLSLSAEGTLVIDAPLVADERLVTNDIAELLPDGRFRILGRRDNIINSGGIKVQIESVEEALRPSIPQPFAITSVPDPKFGEAIILLIEKEKVCEKESNLPLREHLTYHLDDVYLTGETSSNLLLREHLTERGCAKSHVPVIPGLTRDLILHRYSMLSMRWRIKSAMTKCSFDTPSIREQRAHLRESNVLTYARAACSLTRVDTLPKYQRPKQVIEVDAIPLTGSGKIDRAACRKLAIELITNH